MSESNCKHYASTESDAKASPSKIALYRLLFKTVKIYLILMMNNTFISKQVGYQASRRVSRRLAQIQPVCISIMSFLALKGLSIFYRLSYNILRAALQIDNLRCTIVARREHSDASQVNHSHGPRPLLVNRHYVSYLYENPL